MGLIDKIDPLVDADGTEHLTAGNRSQLKHFLDWPSSPNEAGVESGYRALLSWAMHDAELLCNVLGDETHAATCCDIARRMGRKVMPDNGLQQARALIQSVTPSVVSILFRVIAFAVHFKDLQGGSCQTKEEPVTKMLHTPKSEGVEMVAANAEPKKLF